MERYHEVTDLMSTIRTIAFIFIFGPLSAMLVEPFFETLFDTISWDTEDFAVPVVSFVYDYSDFLFGMMGIGVGVWIHFFAQGSAIGSPSNALGAKPPLKVLKSQAVSVGPSKANEGHVLIFGPKMITAEATGTDDGTDVIVHCWTRNRSSQDLTIGIEAAGIMSIDDQQSEVPGDGCSTPYRSGARQAAILGKLRPYESIIGAAGKATLSYRFISKLKPETQVFDVHVDVGFRLLSASKATGKSEPVEVEMIKNDSGYRLKSAEDQ